MVQDSSLKNQLVHVKENTYFVISLVFSISFYLAFLFSIIGIVIIVFMMVFSYFFHALSMASIRRNGVRISEQQFPIIYEKARILAQNMALDKIPNIYVMESSGFLNAFATRFFGKNMVVVYSEIFDLSEEGREDELLFVLAHEFAHLKRRHVILHLLLLPTMFVPFLGEAYLRACEYTCDRYAAYYVNNFEASKEALTMLAIGKKLSGKVNQQAFVEQISEESGFFAWLSEKLSTHPDLPKRINALDHWLNPQQYPLVNEKRSKIVLGIVVSFVLFAAAIGSVIAIGAGSSKLVAFLESDLFAEEFAEDVLPSLSAAVEAHDTTTLQYLISDGEDIEERDSLGLTALQHAIMVGSTESAEILLENGADVNTIDDWGTTPLMNAVHYTSPPEMLELLLSYGADPSLSDDEGYTAYDYAVDYNQTDHIELLKGFVSN